MDNDVFLICLNDNQPDIESIRHFENIGIKIRVLQLSKITKSISLINSVFSGRPFQVGYHYSRNAYNKISKLIDEYNPDIIYCHLLRVAPYVITKKHRKVIDYMDAFGYSMERRANLSSFPLNKLYKVEAKRMKIYEQSCAKYFDSITIISEQDRRRLKFKDSPGMEVIPNGVDLEYFTPEDHDGKKYEIGFIGNLGYLPNVEAAHYIINNIIPGFENITVLICGARPAKSLLKVKLENIYVKGYIEDIRDAYSQIKIFIAPLFSGTGQQNKILEAMAMGVPTITTNEVNNAIGAVPGKQILIANTAPEFVEKIKLLSSNSDLYQEIRNNAITFVHENYSWEIGVTKLTQVFKNINN